MTCILLDPSGQMQARNSQPTGCLSLCGIDNEQQLRSLYAAFNSRDVEAVLASLADDVDWPNVWEGGRLSGRGAVREYWARQWAEIDGRVDPVDISSLPDGRTAVEVRQTVRSLDGALISEGRVRHVYELRDGLVVRMDVAESAQG